MSFDLIGRIKLKDDGASRTIDRVRKSQEQLSRATEQAKRATTMYSNANAQLSRAQSAVSAGAGKVSRELNGVERASKGAYRAMNSLGSKAKNVFRNLGAGLGKGALFGGIAALGTAAYVGGKSLGKAMDFEAQMSTIAALTGATNAEMAKMQALALQMGANTKYNALEAAQGIEELLKAGLTPATVQAGGLEAALNLATAGELDLASAAEIMSTALNAFKEDGMTAAQAANILAGTANASATSVEELRYSLSMTSAVAAGLGMNFKDTNVALGLFANRGLKGSDAGTSLKTMLQTLQPVTKEQIGLFRALGLVTADGSNKFFDAAGNIKSLDEIAGTLRKSLSKLTNQERQHALKLMFGTDAVRAATILFKEGAEGVAEFREEMSKVTALDVARKKMDNAAGAVEQFSGAIETLQIAGMMPLLPIVKDLANAAADFVEKYTPQIVAGVQKMVDGAKNYVKTHFIDNPEFQKLPDIPAKIKFIFNTLMNDFKAWYDAGGKAKFEMIAKNVTDVIATVLGNSGPVVDAAIKLGVAIGEGIVKGIVASFRLPDSVKSLVPGARDEQSQRLVDFNTAMSEHNTKNGPNVPMFGGEATMQAPAPKNTLWDDVKGAFGFNGGINNVPYNGMVARLHKGEEVLTREEAKRYRGEPGANGGGSARPVVISGNNFYVREEADIEKIAKQLAYEMAQ
ncbi:phage tail tape measure protein [Paenibacillus sp. DMB20]|uniref:phage tail tape measure protein n=1 Tax=Paenibacillus sp. DMB20 TaxID=1642570 RepID=UPI0006997B6B|nr:phage tail tape measure protein [Paenibacillus sp. DMB20]